MDIRLSMTSNFLLVVERCESCVYFKATLVILARDFFHRSITFTRVADLYQAISNFRASVNYYNSYMIFASGDLLPLFSSPQQIFGHPGQHDILLPAVPVNFLPRYFLLNPQFQRYVNGCFQFGYQPLPMQRFGEFQMFQTRANRPQQVTFRSVNGNTGHILNFARNGSLFNGARPNSLALQSPINQIVARPVQQMSSARPDSANGENSFRFPRVPNFVAHEQQNVFNLNFNFMGHPQNFMGNPPNFIGNPPNFMGNNVQSMGNPIINLMNNPLLMINFIENILMDMNNSRDSEESEAALSLQLNDTDVLENLLNYEVEALLEQVQRLLEDVEPNSHHLSNGDREV